IVAATDRYNIYNGGPVANQWADNALHAGATDGMIITFSKEENLYSHNTTLSAKKINSILKLSKVTALKGGDIIIINTL
ncbi:MAG: hypothetical protein QQN65_07060, partial [Nitrosopumilus sp.]